MFVCESHSHILLVRLGAILTSLRAVWQHGWKFRMCTPPDLKSPLLGTSPGEMLSPESQMAVPAALLTVWKAGDDIRGPIRREWAPGGRCRHMARPRIHQISVHVFKYWCGFIFWHGKPALTYCWVEVQVYTVACVWCGLMNNINKICWVRALCLSVCEAHFVCYCSEHPVI